MLKSIKKTFIKNYERTADSEVRFRYGMVAGFFGLITNVLLCGLKIAIGLLSGSLSIVADAINNLSDAGSSVVTLVGFKLSSRPADDEHPYGHARFEYIAGLIVTLIVFVIGASLMKQSIQKIISPTEVTVSVVTYVVLGVAILGKLFQMLLYNDFGKSINSDTLIASAADSRNDIVSTSAVLISTIIIHATGYNVDAYMGLVVSVLILLSAVKMIKDIINPLLGAAPDKAFVDKIAEKINGYGDVVLGYHDLMIHSYGPAICYASMHVEVAADKDILETHDAIDNIERDYMRDMNVHMVIHMDPVASNDPETHALKERVTAVIAEVDPTLTIHDFRLVKGNTHTNVLFDVVIPRASKTTLKSIKDLLAEKIQSDTTYYYVINVDTSFVK